ncbi:proline-rich acidic protein 1 [Calonectris borealis]|uniref:proline-rich acidic protein 1 n=1 Tax=Calonectris borealis TaxID=1323832 RepID=UPI003F4BF7CF
MHPGAWGGLIPCPVSPERHRQQDPAPRRTRGPGSPGEQPRPQRGKVQGKGRADPRKAAMERPTAVRLCSITVLLGLLLPAPGGTQAPSNTGLKDLAMEQDLAKEIILGIKAVEPPEEGEISEEVEPGIKVFSSSAWARWGPRQAQAGPEEDRDHLHHPQDDAREDDARGPPRMLSLEVQSGPEEDRDHLHHS